MADSSAPPRGQSWIRRASRCPAWPQCRPLVRETVETVAALEAGESWCLSRLYPAKERLIGLVEPRQHILQDVAVNGCVLRECGADVLQLGFLLVAGEGDATAAVGSDTLLQGRVVEPAARPQDAIQHLLLCGRWFDLVLVGFSQTLLFHTFPFRLAEADSAIGRTSG